ncbi:MAG: integrase arm-type DNA-binding domain-containing protein [Candidatus Sedimenticola sp. (ex Thyasira tokunagai)]
MARQIDKLTAAKVRQENKPGWYADGAGLYLQVSPTLSKSWVYRYQVGGKERRHGLGRYSENDTQRGLTLNKARKAAKACRDLRDNGTDPIDHKRQQEALKALADVKGMTFKDCADKYIESHRRGWKSPKHAQQWENTLATYAMPTIGALSVKDVDVGLVLQVLEAIWHEKPETATRVRQRVESVLDWATARGYRKGENPARWKGHLDKLLPKRSKVQKVKHHKAMPYMDVSEYYIDLLTHETMAARALSFIILTGVRSSEAREAAWSEIDLEAGVWVIPAERMKSGRSHRVPLTDEAVSLLEKVKPFSRDGLVFPGMKRNHSISAAALRKHFKDQHPTLTIHGFRSSFRDWCAEQTNYPRELAEAALAHSLRDQTEAAYQRGDMLERRRKVMEAWAVYCTTKRGDILQLRARNG